MTEETRTNVGYPHVVLVTNKMQYNSQVTLCCCIKAISLYFVHLLCYAGGSHNNRFATYYIGEVLQGLGQHGGPVVRTVALHLWGLGL